jgi:hypothetical protein
MAQLDPAQQTALVNASPLQAEYGTPVDRDSAYEKLLAKVTPAEQDLTRPEPAEASAASHRAEVAGGVMGAVLGSSGFRSFARSADSAAGREITRSIFGTRTRRRSTRRR